MVEKRQAQAEVVPHHTTLRTSAEHQLERLLGICLPDDVTVTEVARLAITHGRCLVQVRYDLELRPVLTVVGEGNG
ncbi:hypothetical protein AA0N74_07920 [Chromobacterium vaccinii]|uniref:hypothetical protein n=1 Tax=Chromobacterium vaccinii TaxID=1108595 RepID=UPI0031CFFD32